MKENGSKAAFLSPEAHGWCVSITGAEERRVPTLAEAVADLPANATLELALPCQAVVIERHKLPSTDRSELEGMLQLQLEKTLPFPLEEVSHGFEVLSSGENESTVLTVAAPYAQLDEICAPLRDSGRIPGRITLFAVRVAALCHKDETTLAIWPEQEQTIIAIVAGQKLAWAQPIAGLEPETVLAELPGLLLGAELDGAPTDFQAIRIAPGFSALAESLAAHFSREVSPLDLQPGTSEGIELLPASWKAESRQKVRGEKLKQNLLLAAVIYLAIVAGAFIYLAWLKRESQKVQAEFDAMKPKFAVIEKQMAQWQALAPAVEPSRYVVVILNHVTKTWKQNANLKFTSLTYTPREWILKGEGTTDAKFEFGQRMKANKELAGFDLKLPPEQPLKDDKVIFTVTGSPAK